MPPALTDLQYDIAYTALTGAFAALAGATLYFVLARSTVSRRYHAALAVGAVVVGVAALHYLRLISTFTDAYEHDAGAGAWLPTGVPIAEGLRYVDWLITVPLLLTQIVLVLRLERAEAQRLIRRLVLAAVAMIALGYPGELADDTTVKLVFWVAGVVPFAYIVYLLWVELNRSMFRYSDDVALTVARARVVLVATWVVYPVAYLFPVLGLDDAGGEVARQVLYSVADVASKIGFGLLIVRIARLLTEEGDARGDDQVDLSDMGRGLTTVET